MFFVLLLKMPSFFLVYDMNQLMVHYPLHDDTDYNILTHFLDLGLQISLLLFSFPSTAHDSFQVSCERLDESYKIDASSQIVLHIQFKANK